MYKPWRRLVEKKRNLAARDELAEESFEDEDVMVVNPVDGDGQAQSLPLKGDDRSRTLGSEVTGSELTRLVGG